MICKIIGGIILIPIIIGAFPIIFLIYCITRFIESAEMIEGEQHE